jgi:hypothetical protein
MKYVALIALATALLNTSVVAQPRAAPHVSREVAISLLRNEGILWGRTRVVSANWGDDTHEWLITLRHPEGGLSAWFVDATGKDYRGGPCKH